MSTQLVTIDAADAIEAAELVAFFESWLAQASEEVVLDFEAFATPFTLVELPTEFLALAASVGSSRMGRA